MDPITQGAVGAAFAQTSADKDKVKAFAIFGALAGMAPDLDVFIQSSTDPFLFLEFHRHFTHSLVFIPIGALLVTLALYRLWRHPLSFRQAYLAAFIGYATHGLLDACTSYGTQLLWPFSNVRIAWNNVSVVDPLFTIPLIALVVIAARRESRAIMLTSLVWVFGYLLFGVYQHDRAVATAHAMAIERGHTPNRLTVKPGFANLMLWKSIYEHQNNYFVDGIRVAFDEQVCVGTRIEKYSQRKHLPKLDLASQQALDIERFRWFSQDYLAVQQHDNAIIDIRYSAVPNDIAPMWGIDIDVNAQPDAHAKYLTMRRINNEQTQQLMDLLAGKTCAPLRSSNDQA